MRATSSGWSSRHAARVERELVLARGSDVRGRVLDARTRAPIAGARVGTGLSDDETYGLVRTDDDGRYRIAGGVERTTRVLHAVAPGYALGRQRTGRPTIDFFLEPGAQARGRVLAPDGSPIEGARVSAHAYSDGPGARWLDSVDSAVTDVDGIFRLGGLAAKRSHDLWIVTPAGPHLHRQIVNPSLAVPIELGDLVVAAGATVTVMLRDAGGVALRQHEAVLSRLEPGGRAHRSHQRVVAALTNDLGRASFTSVAPGTYVLRVNLPGAGGDIRSFRPIVTVPPHEAHVVASFDTGTLRSRLRALDEDGAPIADLQIAAFYGPSHVEAYLAGHVLGGGTTDANGWLDLHVPPGAPFNVYTWTAGHERTPIPIPAGVSEHEVVFHAAAAFSGRLLDRAGRPIADARIRITGEGRDEVVLTTDRDGTFRRRLPKGERVTARFEGEVLDPVSRNPKLIPFEAERPALLSDAQKVVLKVRSVPTREVLEVRVLAPNGDALAGWTVRAIGVDAGATTDHDGVARLENLYGLPCDIAVDWTPSRDRPWLVPATRVVPDGQRIEIRLVAGRPVDGRLVFPDGTPAAGGTVSRFLTPPAPPLAYPVDPAGRFFFVVTKTATHVSLKGRATDAQGRAHAMARWQDVSTGSGHVTVMLDSP